MDPGWILAAISFATVIAGLFAWVLRLAWRLGRRTWQFMAEWEGEPAQHGHKARPGVLERLAALEEGVSGISAQVHLNSGHSMRDTVQRTEKSVDDLKHSMLILSDRVEQIANGKP